MFQWLWFANALEGVTRNAPNEQIYSFKQFFIRLLPVEVVFPCIFSEDQLHSVSSLVLPLPASSSVIDSISLRAFFGLLNKYAVSSSA